MLHELFYGALKSQSVRKNLRAIEELEFPILDFDRNDGRDAGEIRVFLRQQGTPIAPYDVLIAGQARSRGLVLVTHNVKEFSRVPRLVIEDWEV